MQVVKTPSASHLEIKGIELRKHPQNESLKFPDGEVYIQLETGEMEEAAVVHSGSPEPNAGLIQLYGVLDLLRKEKVPVDVFFTYFPYSMQDDEFFPGTLNRVKTILTKLVEYYQVEKVWAVDPHFSHRDWTSEFPLELAAAFPLIQEEVDMEDYVVVGPDLGSVERFGIPGFSKERRDAEEVRVSGQPDVEGRNVLLFDDIIETGGTMAAAGKRLEELGAERVEAAAVHGVLEEGVRRVEEEFDEIHLTNTVDRESASVRVEPLLRENLNL